MGITDGVETLDGLAKVAAVISDMCITEGAETSDMCVLLNIVASETGFSGTSDSFDDLVCVGTEVVDPCMTEPAEPAPRDLPSEAPSCIAKLLRVN